MASVEDGCRPEFRGASVPIVQADRHLLRPEPRSQSGNEPVDGRTQAAVSGCSPNVKYSVGEAVGSSGSTPSVSQKGLLRVRGRWCADASSREQLPYVAAEIDVDEKGQNPVERREHHDGDGRHHRRVDRNRDAGSERGPD